MSFNRRYRPRALLLHQDDDCIVPEEDFNAEWSFEPEQCQRPQRPRPNTVFFLNHIISSHHGVVRLGQAVSSLVLMKSFVLNIQDGSCLNDNESFLDIKALLDLVQEVLHLLCTSNLLVLQLHHFTSAAFKRDCLYEESPVEELVLHSIRQRSRAVVAPPVCQDVPRQRQQQRYHGDSHYSPPCNGYAEAELEELYDRDHREES